MIVVELNVDVSEGKILVLKKNTHIWRDYSTALYCSAFILFAFLLALRESAVYGHIYDFLPIMGRTTPYVILTLLMTTIYKLSGYHLRDIGLGWPQEHFSQRKTIVMLVIAAALILFGRIVTTIPTGFILEQLNVPPTLSRPTDILKDNLPLLLSILPIMWLAVVSEEVLIRGLLMNALANAFGGKRQAWLLAIIVSSVIFGLGHFPNGLRGMIGSGIGGLVYGLGYYLTGRNLLPVIAAHAAGNTIAFVGAYFSD
jgi:membrane protease YdiL (CAAX protease family)